RQKRQQRRDDPPQIDLERQHFRQKRQQKVGTISQVSILALIGSQVRHYLMSAFSLWGEM
ncbi:hypothetical protein CCACVL1_02659, partial [Corchorus capsularis]